MKSRFPEDYYKKYDERYAAVYRKGGKSWSSSAVTEELNRFQRVASLKPPGIGIDIGCGEGRNSIYLAKAGFTMTGIDLAPSGLSKGRELAVLNEVEIEFIVDDALSLLSCKDSVFDVGISVGYLHMFVDEDHRTRLFQQIKRVLRNGSHFLFVNMGNGIDDVRTSPDEYLRPHKKDLPGIGEEIELALLPRWERTWNDHRFELAGAGFEIIDHFDSVNEEYGPCMSVVLKKT